MRSTKSTELHLLRCLGSVGIAFDFYLSFGTISEDSLSSQILMFSYEWSDFLLICILIFRWRARAVCALCWLLIPPPCFTCTFSCRYDSTPSPTTWWGAPGRYAKLTYCCTKYNWKLYSYKVHVYVSGKLNASLMVEWTLKLSLNNISHMKISW